MWRVIKLRRCGVMAMKARRGELALVRAAMAVRLKANLVALLLRGLCCSHCASM